jgi:hypothetical protein
MRLEVMKFDIQLLDKLDHDAGLEAMHDYIDSLVEQFSQSPEGQSYAEKHSEFGGWIGSFIDLAYAQEGFTLATMTKRQVEVLMEDTLPRKITLGDRSDAEDATSELAAFWTFLEREYQLKNANAISQYLNSIENKFPDWMFDPDRGGMAKSFVMSGMQAGFDMASQEGLNAFMTAYNAQLLQQKPDKPDNSLLKKLGNLFQMPLPGEEQLPRWLTDKSLRQRVAMLEREGIDKT